MDFAGMHENKCIKEETVSLTRHLIVCQHGLHGFASDWENFVKTVQCTLPFGIRVYVSSANENFTSDGVANGGRRLAAEIIAELGATCELDCYISLIGHSLGGLYIRYAAEILHRTGVFTKHRPINFITLASPHLGIRRDPNRSLFNSMYITIANWLCRSTREMLLQDNTEEIIEHGMPVLQWMTSDSYISSLRAFKRRSLYANISHDIQVPFSTASILPYNPFQNGDKRRKMSQRFSKGIYKNQQNRHEFPHIVGTCFDSIADSYDSNSTFFHERGEIGVVLRSMLSSLQSLEWRRIACSLNPVGAHVQIIGKHCGFYDLFSQNSCLDICKHVREELII